MKKIIAMMMVFMMLAGSVYAGEGRKFYIDREKTKIITKIGAAAVGGAVGYGAISLSGLTAVGAMGEEQDMEQQQEL